MMIINEPKPQTIEVKCYICNTIMQVSPMTSMSAPYLTDCDMHKPKSDGIDWSNATIRDIRNE